MLKIIETLCQKPLSLGWRKVPVPSGDADECEAENPLWLLRSKAGGDQRAERLSDEMAAIDVERSEPSIERRRIITRAGRLDRKWRRSPVAGCIPGDHPKSSGQPLQLVPERGGGRSYTVQQDERQAAAGIPIGEAGIAGPHGPGARIDGVPVGLSIVGGHGSDAALVAVARALEAAR